MLPVIPLLCIPCNLTVSLILSAPVPDVSWADFKHVVDNPSPARTRHCARASERKTWEYISDVRVRCGVELALDDAIQRLRLKLGPAAEAKPMTRTPSWVDLCM
jgi:hypothetical protein